MPAETIRPKKTKPTVPMVATFVLVALGAAAFMLGRTRLGDAGGGEQVALFAAREGPLRITVTESGTIKPKDQVIITSQVEGRTTILYLIPEGTRVKKGQLLVELDASKLEDAKVDQEIRVQNAEAAAIRSRENLEVVRSQGESDVDKTELALRFANDDLRKYKEGEYPNQVKELEARITLAEEDVHRTEEKLKWSKVLFEEKYLAETELQADELAAKKARLDLDLARNNLALFKEYTCKRTLAQLESDVKQGKMALERVKRRAAADLVQAKADLAAKESEYRRQQSKLQKIVEQIAKARIVAPTDGLVVYATSAKASWRGNKEPLDEGQEVRERQELIYLPTASTFVAEVKVHESSLDKIRTGLPVRVTLDALPGKEFSATVSRIAPLPDAQSMFMNPDLKIYRTQITINGGGDMLRTGMTCQAEIVVAEYPKTLYVPVQSVVRVNGRPTVYVWKNGAAVPRTVKIGLDNNRMVRVLDGLAAGEKVLLTPPLRRSVAVESARTPPKEAAEAGAEHPVGGAAEKRRAERESPGKGASVPSRTEAGRVPPGKAAPGATPDAVGRRPAAFGGGRRGGRKNMTPEQIRQMRERFRKMTPAQREAMRKRWMQARGRRHDAGDNGG
ncbi:MAG: efflux RND transporter periplasmic adaptor subunit [Kiritimatiellaeota bacterium]|nr:efflux RND transporter periplasmic adaptor subunit [Kiritimatiellota bacterium]